MYNISFSIELQIQTIMSMYINVKQPLKNFDRKEIEGDLALDMGDKSSEDDPSAGPRQRQLSCASTPMEAFISPIVQVL